MHPTTLPQRLLVTDVDDVDGELLVDEAVEVVDGELVLAELVEVGSGDEEAVIY
jgi:hypothetical protein